MNCWVKVVIFPNMCLNKKKNCYGNQTNLRIQEQKKKKKERIREREKGEEQNLNSQIFSS